MKKYQQILGKTEIAIFLIMEEMRICIEMFHTSIQTIILVLKLNITII